MVCERLAKVTQMRHENMANASRLLVSVCSSQLEAEPRCRALAGEKGMVECQRVDDVEVLLGLEPAAIVVVIVVTPTSL